MRKMLIELHPRRKSKNPASEAVRREREEEWR